MFSTILAIAHTSSSQNQKLPYYTHFFDKSEREISEKHPDFVTRFTEKCLDFVTEIIKKWLDFVTKITKKCLDFVIEVRNGGILAKN